MRALASFGVGVLFSVGLGVGGMTRPSKVIGFLDVGGHFDPSLAFVMGGAVLVTLLLFPLVLRQRRPLLAPAFDVPNRRAIDGRLLAGAAVFGVGWGLSGMCPGPAVTALATGQAGAWAFFGAMLAGAAAYRYGRIYLGRGGKLGANPPTIS